jgi:hypothetical protein
MQAVESVTVGEILFTQEKHLIKQKIVPKPKNLYLKHG